ncbi:Guanine nucleotide-binding protein G(q) subunit alpha [Anabarilius grahami]|uniref:Guanine nucleotide-binding protein G(Q) subunit alpha n=1 Tax=Anabarilius grahami TaxID=495550 RepID=A0A3N0Y3K3_ANAGA|nr:Guanine nucleotide-binding protein G(q) subunit alpha [Anabarilius grahami]
MSAITEAMSTLKIPYSNPQNELIKTPSIYAQWFQDQDIHQITQLQRSYVEAIRHLWEDQGFKICYKRHREYQLLDSTGYFIYNLDRIAAEDYIPTTEDILRVRSPTNGITEQCISRERLTMRIVNIGGQRGQRRKWIHCFQNVTSLIFVASLSEYDQLLEENNRKNRMKESLSLFYTTIHSPLFAKSSVILLLNKMDILAETIQFSDLKTYFPGFKEDRNAIAINKEIKHILAEHRKRERREVKLLLLGTGESGKTTFMKQMRIIHGNGFSEDEKRSYTKLVFQNIFKAMSAITEAMSTLKIPYSNPQNEVIKTPSVFLKSLEIHEGHFMSTIIWVIYAQRFQDQDIHQITQLQRSYVEAIRHLWEDKGIKMCYKRRREYQLLDSTKYFIGNLDRITAEGYIPTNQDILQVRFPTTGITDHCFTLEKMTLRIVDVGGQRGQRRKWIHCFENVMSLIFLASLSEYDQLLEENNKDNRMEESLSLFYMTIHSMWFANSSVILFLNKLDILAEKIQFSDLKTYFPGFEGKRRDVQDAMVFIRSLYKHKAVSYETKNSKNIYSHFTCATDTRNIQKVFNAVKDTVLLLALEEFKIL